LKEITAVCLECGHKASLSQKALEEKLGGPPTLSNILEIRELIVCKVCKNKHFKLLDSKGNLLYDPDYQIPCTACGEPIILTRLKAIPGTNLCMKCKEEGEKPFRHPPHPKPPKDQSICPRCKSDTAMYQNRHDKVWFVGCLTFPSCRWSSDLKS